MFVDRRLQAYPAEYNFSDEYFRFSSLGESWLQAAGPGSSKWNETLEAYLKLDHTFVPTFNIFEANRDLMRVRQGDWHKDYTWSAIWKYFQPQRGGHGSYWYRWSTSNEVDWRRNYAVWLQFINDYKNLGGRVCAGSDSGFLYQIYGFGLIREMELLQEAGFNPLEVWKAVTLDGATLLGIDEVTGTIEVGKRADLIIHQHNPLADTKLLYGTGAMRLNDSTAQVEWHRSIEKTIKRGVVFDASQLLADVRTMVAQSYDDA